MLRTRVMSRLAVRRRALGQGLTEYLGITALIAVAAFGAVSLAGNAIQASIARMASEISGDTGGAAAAKTEAKTQADNAKTQAAKKKDIADYDTQNDP